MNLYVEVINYISFINELKKTGRHQFYEEMDC